MWSIQFSVPFAYKTSPSPFPLHTNRIIHSVMVNIALKCFSAQNIANYTIIAGSCFSDVNLVCAISLQTEWDGNIPNIFVLCHMHWF